ncbi:MAG TPA: hypothetical protein VG759_20405, partial [Candidatus Angelobacter sp.]|nr:hypothetical protein [Candidatus Angelobacter sp.]
MKHVIIGDSDDEHFECICKIIESSFNLNVEPAKSIGEILKKISSPKGAEIKLVLLTEHLPYSANAMRAYFERCHGAERGADRDNHCWIGLVYDGNNPYSRLNLNSDICEVSLPYPSCEEAERLFRERLGAIFGDLKLPDVTLANDMQLKVQVDELAKHWKRNDGEEVLRRLLGGFFSISLMVQRLRSGGSGALVFRVQPLSLGQDAQYLIKFTEDKWKLKEEAKKHPTVVGGTPDYRRYTAEILEPKPESQRDGHVVRCGGWYAICFRFLGGSSFGESVDLEEVLTGPARRMACLSSDDMPTLEAYRTRILSIVLDWLKRHWCANTKYTIRLDQQPWTTVDAEDNAYESLPPYTLRGDVKYRIRQFIDGPKAGESLLSNWPQLADFVKGFVNHTGSGDGSKMNHHVSMILSPAHGDLNANNVLFFPELQDPIFLIDFAMYQEHGHALQDFARLEAEIKYA